VEEVGFFFFERGLRDRFVRSHSTFLTEENTMVKIIKLLLALFASIPLIFFVAWGASQYETLIKENPSAFVETIYAGVYIITNANREMEIVFVRKDFPADKAGIRVGDIIVSADNVKVNDRFTLFKIFYEGKKPGNSIPVVLKRNGEPLNTAIQFSSVYLPKDEYILRQEVTKDKALNLAIIVTELSNVYLQGEPLEQWKRGMKSFILGQLENRLREFLKYEKKASIISKENVESVLKKLAFQQTGMISEDSQIKIGNMLGATHLLIVTIARFEQSPSKANDIEIRRLIDINSGKTMASISLKRIVNLEKGLIPIR